MDRVGRGLYPEDVKVKLKSSYNIYHAYVEGEGILFHCPDIKQQQTNKKTSH